MAVYQALGIIVSCTTVIVTAVWWAATITAKVNYIIADSEITKNAILKLQKDVNRIAFKIGTERAIAEAKERERHN